MKKSRSDAPATKATIKALDALTRRYGLQNVKYAASRWLTVQRVRASVAKEKRALEKRLSEINAKLK